MNTVDTAVISDARLDPGRRNQAVPGRHRPLSGLGLGGSILLTGAGPMPRMSTDSIRAWHTASCSAGV